MFVILKRQSPAPSHGNAAEPDLSFTLVGVSEVSEKAVQNFTVSQESTWSLAQEIFVKSHCMPERILGRGM